MNYHGEEIIYIYATDACTERLNAVGSKRMWTYVDDGGGRPRLVAKFGDRYLPVSRRAGRKFIIVADDGNHRPQPRPATVEAAVAEMAAMGKESKPELAGRMDSAAELVLLGRVTLANGGKAQVGPYRVAAGRCTCADYEYRGGWCKHRLAARMARHLAANGFELPPARVEPTTPQISAENLALIASGKVIDNALRERAAYAQSSHGARTAALRMLANGAKTLPADLARRAGLVTSDERRVTNEEEAR